jgi:histidyl-tRNA synthetase
LREHWQLNVDIFGSEDVQAELETIRVADSILKTFGATHDMYTIKLNSRKLMDFIMNEYLELNQVQTYTLSKLIDRMHKMPAEAFDAEVEALFSPSQREAGAHNKLHGLLKTKHLDALPERLRELPSVVALQKLLTQLKAMHIPNVIFDITVMRGFDYYTDIVFEVNDTHPENNRSMFGGGRYDGLVGLFGVEPVPTVGFGMGDVTLQNFLEGHDLMPKLRSETDVFAIIVGDVAEKAEKVIDDLREMGLHIAVDFTGRKIDKQIKTASKKDVHYALFIGERELKDEQYVLRNLQTGVEERHSASRIVSIVKDYRED